MYSQKWDELYESVKYEVSYNIQRSRTKQFHKAIKYLEECKFIHESILNKLDDFSKYEISLNNVPITIFNDTEQFDLGEKIGFVYNFIYALAKQPNEKITVFLFPIDIPKTLSKPIASVKNINSGVCISMSSGETIVIIWRLEEILKVLVHELIHAHELDLYEYNSKLKKLLAGFKLSTKSVLAPNESITDTLTFIVMSFVNGKWLNRQPDDIFEKEVLWTLKQMIKIWSHFEDKDNIHQFTDVLSYYFIKGIFLHTILMNHAKLNLFLSKCTISGDDVINKKTIVKDILKICRSKHTYKQLKKTMLTLDEDKTTSLKMSLFS